MYIQSPGVLKWLDFLNWFFVKDYPSCHFKATLSTYLSSLFQDNFLFSFLSGISKSNPITFCIDFDTTYSQHSFSFSFSFDSDESDGTPTPVPATSPAKLAICQIKFTTARAEHLIYWQQKGVGCPKGGAERNCANCVSNKTFAFCRSTRGGVSCELSMDWNMENMGWNKRLAERDLPRSVAVWSILNA